MSDTAVDGTTAWTDWPVWDLRVLEPADPRVVGLAVAAGIAFDVGARSGVVSVGGSIAVLVACAALLIIVAQLLFQPSMGMKTYNRLPPRVGHAVELTALPVAAADPGEDAAAPRLDPGCAADEQRLAVAVGRGVLLRYRYDECGDEVVEVLVHRTDGDAAALRRARPLAAASPSRPS